MANYYRTYRRLEADGGSETEITLLLSDSYDAIIDPLTTYQEVKNVEIEGESEEYQGDTYSIEVAAFTVSAKSALLFNDLETENRALLTELNNVVTNNGNFFARILVDNEVLVTARLNVFETERKTTILSKSNYTNTVDTSDYFYTFEQLGLNLIKDVLVKDILTDGVRDVMLGDGRIERKPGAYAHPTSGLILQTGHLVNMSALLEVIVEKLSIDINANYPITIDSYLFDANDCSIGEATPFATNLMELNGEYRPEAYFCDPKWGFPTGNQPNSYALDNCRQTLYLDSLLEEELLWIPANSAFDMTTASGDNQELFMQGYANEEGDTYRIATSFDKLYDLLDFVAECFSLTFNLYIDDTTLILKFQNNDTVSNNDIYMTGILDDSDKILTPENNEDDSDIDLVNLVDAYTFEERPRYQIGSSKYGGSRKPILFTLGGSYPFNPSFGQVIHHRRFTPPDITGYSTICPNTTIFMKVATYNSAGDNPNFTAYRPTTFFAPVGRLSYKVNADSNENFTKMLDRINYFKDRYSGAKEDVNPIVERTFNCVGISRFSISATGSNPSAIVLRAGKTLVVDGERFRVTKVERDFIGMRTSITAIGNGFFGSLTPTSDSGADNADDVVEILPGGGSGDEENGQGASQGAINIFDLVAYDSNGLLILTDNTTDYYNRVVGFAISKYTNSNNEDIITVQKSGYLTNSSWSFTVGNVIFAVSNGATISLTDTEPTQDTNNDMMIIIGVAVATDTINLSIHTHIWGQ